jgi:nicotinamidase-related amidase
MVKAIKKLSLPSFVNLNNASKWSFGTDLNKIAQRAKEFRDQNAIKPCGGDKVKTELLIIDAQKDFCFPPDNSGDAQGGTLYVAGRSGTGSIDDNKRLVSFLYNYMDRLTNITATMDTHFPYQIFFSPFWQDEHEQPLAPFTTITSDMVKHGKAVPTPVMAHIVAKGNYQWVLDYAKHYTKVLEDDQAAKGKSSTGKYQLLLWPFHCMLGTDGHALVGLVQEALLMHSLVRGAPGNRETKGGNYLTENYSVLSPEVLVAHDNRAIAQRNTKFIEKLLTNDYVFIAGQAASHCVKSTISDLLNAIMAQDKSLAKKVYIITDTMSAVTVPDGKGGFFADYTKNAEDAYAEFSAAGMHLVTTATPMDQWPDIQF